MSTTRTTSLIGRRIEAIDAWLDDVAPFAVEEQKHLDGGSAEQAYWHLGYRTALQDALELLMNDRAGKRGRSTRSPEDALDG